MSADKIDELWNMYSRRYECTRHDSLSFVCSVWGDGVLKVAWIPETNSDIEQLYNLYS